MGTLYSMAKNEKAGRRMGPLDIGSPPLKNLGNEIDGKHDNLHHAKPPE